MKKLIVSAAVIAMTLSACASADRNLSYQESQADRADRRGPGGAVGSASDAKGDAGRRGLRGTPQPYPDPYAPN